jgi:hypothetical protein
MIPCSWAASRASGNLLRDGQRLVERDRAERDALRQVLALDEFHHDRTHTAAFFEAVDVRDVRVIDRRQRLRFAGEPREPVGVARRTSRAVPSARHRD